MRARVFEVKRFAVHDGDGIRTTVFFKGCPLRCLWCHNPEGLDREPQIAYYAEKCIGCGDCAVFCPTGAQEMDKSGHVFERTRCIGCGQCATACLGEALRFYGRETTVDDLMPLLLTDRAFYETSGGGVTLSGGECLCEADFCAELLRRLKAEGIRTAVDTCGFVPRTAFDKVLPFTDVFLYDLKAYDAEVHRRLTGVANGQILSNLQYLDAVGAAVEIRIPYVPACNAGEIGKIADFLAGLTHVTGVRVLPYHNYAAGKYRALGIEDTLPQGLPTDEEIEAARTLIEARTPFRCIR